MHSSAHGMGHDARLRKAKQEFGTKSKASKNKKDKPDKRGKRDKDTD